MRPAKKRLGQHFLHDRAVVARILQAADVGPGDTVLEIGPGRGILTFPLVERGARVFAVEVDPDLCADLRERGKDFPALRILQGDALAYPLEEIPAPFKVVANLPYNVGIPLLFRLLTLRDRVVSMTLMLQKEVIDRMTASPGGKDWGVLSAAVQFHTTAGLCFIVSRRAFTPPPRVDSAVVHLVPRAVPAAPVRDADFMMGLVRSAFSHRRKTLPNALSSHPTPKPAILDALREAGIDPRRRPETLTLAEWGRLADILFEFNRGSC
ncbi:MAG: ribosomal RNA small subunit methyltransferase A [Nitrospirae bacterium]|nr:ribosomal RNA small subunit methyltransferase A [Nitrospirota bacterium]